MPDMMSRRGLLLSAAAAAARARSIRPPNFIFILADDLGWRDLSIYGSRYYETPNLDRLASEGMRFTNAYAACPVCSPTRASILTGKYPARLHLTDWIPGRTQNPSARVLTPPFRHELPLEEETLAEALKPAGYISASIGKWHLGGPGFYPTDQGFDLNVGGTERGSPQSYFGPFHLPGLEEGAPGEYLTDRLHSEASRFLRHNPDRPFLLYLPEFAVHLPLQAKQQMIAKYKAKPAADGQRNPVYAAMVESLDLGVGRLLRELDELRIADRTVVFFMSDNGGLRYEGKRPDAVTSNAPLRAGKGHLYEGGIREPLIVRWPGVVKAASVCDVPVSSIDFFPTMLEMAALRNPAGKVDGVSLVPLLRGHAMKHRALYWHYPHYSNQGGVPGGAIRDGEIKLIEFFEDGRTELFHLREDVSEQHNLVRKMPAKARELRERLLRWRTSVNAAMPKPNPVYDPEKAEERLTGAESPTPPD